MLTTRTRRRTTITSMADQGGLALFAWLSPAFPVGSFAYSHGLEWAHEAGDVRDAATLNEWLRDVMELGSWRSDAIIMACAHRAVAVNDAAALYAVAELAAALSPSSERRLETVQQGNAFVLAARAAWPNKGLEMLAGVWPGPVAYPVALGVTAAGHDIELGYVTKAYGMTFVQNLTSAAIRLGVIGQTDGQRVIALLLPVVTDLAEGLCAGSIHEIGGCAYRSDLAAMRHETQYTRLFRS